MKERTEPPAAQPPPGDPRRDGGEPPARLNQIHDPRQSLGRQPEHVLNDVIDIRASNGSGAGTCKVTAFGAGVLFPRWSVRRNGPRTDDQYR